MKTFEVTISAWAIVEKTIEVKAETKEEALEKGNNVYQKIVAHDSGAMATQDWNINDLYQHDPGFRMPVTGPKITYVGPQDDSSIVPDNIIQIEFREL